MRDTLYRKQISKSIRQPDKDKFLSVKDEIEWVLKGNRDFRYIPNSTPYGTYYNHEYCGSTTPIKQPHGDFHSDYAYQRSRFLTKGALFVGGVVRTTKPSPPYYYQFNSSVWGNFPQATWTGGMAATSPTLNSIKSEAQDALVKKVLKGFPLWDVMTDIAELKETMGFLYEGTSRIKDIVKGCLLRQPKTVLKAFKVSPTRKRVNHVSSVIDRNRFLVGSTSASAVKSAADLWLSYRYGLMPLLYSAEDAINAFNVGKITYKKTFQVTFKSNEIKYLNTSQKQTFARGMLFCDYVSRGVSYFSYRLRATVDFTDNLTSRLGLNPWAVPKTLWEVVPFPWVIDWFFDVNGWLDKLRLESIVGSLKVVGTLKDRVIETRELANIRTDGYWTTFKPVVLAGVQTTAECRTFSREIIALNASPPPLVQGLDRFKRYLDTISLGIQFARSPSLKGIPK